MNRLVFYKASIVAVVFLTGSASLLNVGVARAATTDTTADTPAQPHVDAVSQAMSDTVITTKIKAKLMNADGLGKSDISVTTTNGEVTLDGSASTSRARAEAEALTNSVEGVQGVDNNLKIQSSHAMSATSHKIETKTDREMSDSWITTKVKSAILGDSISKGFDVRVVTHHGMVSLTGVLSSQDAVDHVKGIVRRVKGVRGVNVSTLTVAGT
jgi:hyperosmotically inducible protein